jgi:hypothetical protein
MTEDWKMSGDHPMMPVIAPSVPSHPRCLLRVGSWFAATCETLLLASQIHLIFDLHIAMKVIEIRPHRWGRKAFEAPGVEPVFPNQDQAIDYAQTRARFSSGEVRIFDSTGNVERVIPFDDATRKL